MVSKFGYEIALGVISSDPHIMSTFKTCVNLLNSVISKKVYNSILIAVLAKFKSSEFWNELLLDFLSDMVGVYCGRLE